MDERSGGHLSSYHLNVINGSFFVISADDNKKLVIIWAKCLGASEKSYLAFSENAIDCWILSYY